jgi:hypothetical protein
LKAGRLPIVARIAAQHRETNKSRRHAAHLIYPYR